LAYLHTIDSQAITQRRALRLGIIAIFAWMITVVGLFSSPSPARASSYNPPALGYGSPSNCASIASHNGEISNTTGTSTVNTDTFTYTPHSQYNTQTTSFNWGTGSVSACDNNGTPATYPNPNDQTVLSWSGYGLAFQCIELVTRYAYARWGDDPRPDWAGGSWGGDAQYALATHPSHFDVEKQGQSTLAPAKGDIIVWVSANHIAIVTNVDPAHMQLTTLEQNFYWNSTIGYLSSRTIPYTVSGGKYSISSTYTVPFDSTQTPQAGDAPQGWLHNTLPNPTAGAAAKWTGVLSNGSVAVFKHDSSDAVSYRYQTTPGSTTWSAWTELANPSDDTIVGEPTVARNADGRLFVFARGASGKIWLLTQQTLGNATTWNAWSNFTNPSGETMVGDPAVVPQGDGSLYMFVVGASGMVRVQNQTSPGGAWVSTGYSQFSNPSGRTMVGNPAAVQGEDGRIYVFVRDNTGQIRLQNQTTVNGGWLSGGYTQFSNPSGYTMVGNPAVAAQADGSIYLFVRDNSGQIRVQNQTSPNGSWVSTGFSQFGNPSGHTMIGDPTTVSQANGSLYVFVRDDTNQIRVQNQTAPNGSWVSTGFSQFSNPTGVTMPVDPAAARDSSGILHLFSVGSDTQMYEAHQTAANGGWQVLSAFGGTFPTS
jgi:CHAP domain